MTSGSLSLPGDSRPRSILPTSNDGSPRPLRTLTNGYRFGSGASEASARNGVDVGVGFGFGVVRFPLVPGCRSEGSDERGPETVTYSGPRWCCALSFGAGVLFGIAMSSYRWHGEVQPQSTQEYSCDRHVSKMDSSFARCPGITRRAVLKYAHGVTKTRYQLVICDCSIGLLESLTSTCHVS